MPLIEISNVYNSDMAVGAAGRGRFAVIGEPIVAVFMSDPAQLRRPRRCASPACSMIFIAVNPSKDVLPHPAGAATRTSLAGISSSRRSSSSWRTTVPRRDQAEA